MFGFIKRVNDGRITISKIWKADVSSDSPSPKRIEQLWVVDGFHEGVEELGHLWKYGDVNLYVN